MLATGGINMNEKSYMLEGGGRRHLSEDRGSSIDSNENAFDDMKQLISDDENDKTNTLPWASFNFINSILGSGVIGIPYALHESGFGFGILLLIFVAFVTDYSLILMVRSGHISGKFSYQGIMEAAFGRAGYIFLGILQFVYPFIAMVSYNIVVGDTVTKVIVRLTGIGPDSIFAKREVIVLIATIFITIPLCLYRDVAKLAKVSFLSLICIVFILFSIFMRIGPLSDIVPQHPESWSFINKDIIPAIGIMAFAFMCHHNTFLIYSSLADASQKKWEIVTHISILTSLVVAIMFGIAGYSTFKAYSQGDLLENYCWDDDLMNISRLLFSIQILLTYPIECLVSREVIETSLFSRDPNVPVSEKLHYLITLGVVITTYLISITTYCLGVVLELNGVLAAVPLAYVLPALCYLRLEEGFIFCRKKLPALGVVLFGLVVAIMGAIFLIVDIDQVDTCIESQVMEYCNRTITNMTYNST
ncbi:putative sodium-coupled neutral amino acid transporter 11 [Diorhabda carinulata]|uniref:putative sodium-coupled neutral amino acid transporter 11 n=1 Tax=Diorhabda carinulata TaxID=1163345 RepID=UPI0025A0EE6B|nr:putative sodium-coupled neutral amino acid transporter 11 [Diorhabda carinulata]